MNKVKLSQKKSCWRCLGTGHNGRDSAKIRQAQCKAFNATCRKCNKTGHFAQKCKFKVEDALNKEEEDLVKSNRVQVNRMFIKLDDMTSGDNTVR